MGRRTRLSQSPSHDLDISSGSSRRPSALRSSLAPSALGLFGLFLGFLLFSIFSRAYISSDYQKY